MIEFRAWDKKTQEMYEVIGIDFRINKVHIGYFENPHWGSRARDLGDVVLEQYTGLKDKDGQKGYHKDKAVDENGGEYVIEWSDEGAAFYLMPVGEVSLMKPILSMRALAEQTIVGNIHE